MLLSSFNNGTSTLAKFLDLYDVPKSRDNVYYTDNEIVIQMEAPGFTAEDIVITTQYGCLTVAGHVSNNKTADTKALVPTNFERRFHIGRGTSTDQISAELSKGILTIRIPKEEELKAKRIPVLSK